MPLTQDEANELLNGLAKTTGCPVTIPDKLDAFRAGMQVGISGIMDKVSLDRDEAGKTEGGSEQD